jgi:hypothetical protein
MDADDDAWSAEIRCLPATPAPDPLALEEDTAERLLAGDLRLDQAPTGYAEVAALLAVIVAAPSPPELAGQQAALAELRAVARAHRARTREVGKPGRRRRVGLVVAIAAVALSVGGIAAAATGNLPDPIRDAAPSILATQGDAVPIPLTKPGRQPNPSAGAADAAGASTHAQGPRPAGEPGTTAMTGAVKDDRCRASKARKGVGKQMAAAAVDALAAATGGGDKRATLPAISTRRLRNQGAGRASQVRRLWAWAGQRAASKQRRRQPEPGRPPEAGPHRR